MSQLSVATYRELVRIRKKHLRADEVRAAYHEAKARYEDAVINGDGSQSSGDIILGHLATRDAYKRYAEENNIKLEVK